MISFTNLIKTDKTKLFLKWASMIIFSLFIFCILAFSGRKGLEKITYIPITIMCVLSILIFLTKPKIIIDWKLFTPLIFVFFAMISTIIGTRNFNHILTLFILSFSIFPCYFLCSYIKSSVSILYCISVPIFIFALYFTAFYYKHIFTFDFSLRIGAEFGNVNDVSMNMLYGAVASLLLALFCKQYWMYLPTVFLSYLCLFAQSKKSIIVLFLAIVFLIAFKNRKRPLLLFVQFGLIVLFIVMLISVPAFYPIVSRFFDMFNTSTNSGVNDSTTLRELYFNTALHLGFDHFLIGYGSEGFYSLTYYGTYSHANLSELICNFGIIGFISFYFNFPFLLLVEKKEKEIKTAFNFAFLIMFIFYSFSSIFYTSKMFFVLFSISICFSAKKDIVSLIKDKSFNLVDDSKYMEINI